MNKISLLLGLAGGLALSSCEDRKPELSEKEKVLLLLNQQDTETIARAEKRGLTVTTEGFRQTIAASGIWGLDEDCDGSIDSLSMKTLPSGSEINLKGSDIDNLERVYNRSIKNLILHNDLEGKGIELIN